MSVNSAVAALDPECRIESGAASAIVSNATDVQFTESHDGGGAKVPADAQLINDDASSDYVRFLITFSSFMPLRRTLTVIVTIG